MRWLAGASVAFILAATAAGGEPWIDYELFLDRLGAKVVQSRNETGELVRSYDSGDGLTVVCVGDKGQAACRGVDMKQGPGCLFTMLGGLRDIARTCDGFATEEELHRLETFYGEVGTYVARNAVPQMSWPELQDRLAAERVAPKKEQCPHSFDPDLVALMRRLISPEGLKTFSASATEARLPTINPCL